MTGRRALWGLLLPLLAALAACTPASASAPLPIPTSTPAATVTPVAMPGSTVCHSVGGHADPACTPGATNPAVTQATIGSTICKTGWTATIRPPTSYTNGLKQTDMRRYGQAGPASQYEEDHLLPLELGGNPTDPRNLWSEPWNGPQGAHVKDAEENRLRSAVCARQMTLADAQAQILRDWR